MNYCDLNVRRVRPLVSADERDGCYTLYLYLAPTVACAPLLIPSSYFKCFTLTAKFR